MGRFAIDFVVANNRDIVRSEDRRLAREKVRRQTVRGVVDSGAVRLVLPKITVEELGLKPTGRVKVRYADGRTATRETVQNVYVEILGRGEVFGAIIEPKRKSALIGAIVLEALDLLVDCTHQRLVPRDPKMIVSEIE